MCEIGPGVLSCKVQDTWVKKGYVMDFHYNWHKKKSISKHEVMLEHVDWRMLHNSGSCIKTMQEREPELYHSEMKKRSAL